MRKQNEGENNIVSTNSVPTTPLVSRMYKFTPRFGIKSSSSSKFGNCQTRDKQDRLDNTEVKQYLANSVERK